MTGAFSTEAAATTAQTTAEATTELKQVKQIVNTTLYILLHSSFFFHH